MKRRMAQAKHRLCIKVFGLALAILLAGQLVACSSAAEREFAAGEKATSDGHFRIAVTHFEKVITREPATDLGIKAAKEAARVAFFDIKDYKRATNFYKHLVLYSKNEDDRVLAQKQIADIYFEQLSDYPRAVIEINKLVSMLDDPKEKAFYKMALARAYYYQNDFLQAENETDEFLRGEIPVEQRFEMLILKGNINLARKNLTKAAEIFRGLLKDYPEQSKRDNVALTLSVCYEEMKDYRSAMQVLEELKAHHPMPEYIDLRIKRLEGRLKNLPGARGKFRK